MANKKMRPVGRPTVKQPKGTPVQFKKGLVPPHGPKHPSMLKKPVGPPKAPKGPEK